MGGNPLNAVDPQGLILFAFDGTGNSRNPPKGDAISNVLKFYEAYDTNLNGQRYYITGIGTTDENMSVKGDVLDGTGFDERVQLGFKFLDDFLRGDAGKGPLDIDVVGFSRGGAEARVWVNKLVTQLDHGVYTAGGASRCINLRFEGLWDSVPHLGYFNGNESNYDFGIPDTVKYAAQANAINEYRGGPTNFNFRSILSSAGSTSPTRIERGFLGAHSDIGGGYGTGDLSDVALMWMLEEAGKQGIHVDRELVNRMGWNAVTNPVVHDSSSNLLKDPKEFSEDRYVQYSDGKHIQQRKAQSGVLNFDDTLGLISYRASPITSDHIAGDVDAKAYVKWLNSHCYGVSMQYNIEPNPMCDSK